MKKVGISIAVLVLAFNFTACTTNETGLENAPQPLLKKYKLSQDVDGHYSIDYTVADKTTVDVHKDLSSFANQVYLSKANHQTSNEYQTDLSLDNSQLKVNFIDGNTNKKPSITVQDDKIKFAKGTESARYLKSYDMVANGDGTYTLDFTVKDNIKTSFAYDEANDTYQIHLAKGQSDEDTFSKTFTMSDTGTLKINFVNHQVKAGKGLGILEATIDKPKIIIVGD